MRLDQISYINNIILNQAKAIKYTVKDNAPSSTEDLFNSTSLVIWSGASDTSIYKDSQVNYAFRALHDTLHIKTKLPFTLDSEIELARIQASQYDSDLMRELIYCEVAGQVEYFKKYGKFPENQLEFTINYLKSKGVI